MLTIILNIENHISNRRQENRPLVPLTVVFDLVVAIAVGMVMHYLFVLIKKLIAKKS